MSKSGSLVLFVCLDSVYSSLSRWNRWTQDYGRQGGSGWQKGHGSRGRLQNRSDQHTNRLCSENVFGSFVHFPDLVIIGEYRKVDRPVNREFHLTAHHWHGVNNTAKFTSICLSLSHSILPSIMQKTVTYLNSKFVYINKNIQSSDLLLLTWVWKICSFQLLLWLQLATRRHC